MDDCSDGCRVGRWYSKSHRTSPHTSAVNHGNGSDLGSGMKPFSMPRRHRANRARDSRYMLICGREGRGYKWAQPLGTFYLPQPTQSHPSPISPIPLPHPAPPWSIACVLDQGFAKCGQGDLKWFAAGI